MALSDDAADRLVRAQAALIQLLARAAFAKMWRALGEDSALSPRDAIQAAQADFGGAFARALAGAFSELLQRSVGVAEVRAMPVGDIALSQRLHRHDAQTMAEVLQAIKAHAQGVHQARELALALYDGYSPAQGPKRPLEGRSRADLPRYLRELTNDPEARQSLARVIEQGQAQAARLKSAPLRAAYTEALDAWEAGAGREALKRRLEIAQREKNRFFANRIAQTELARAHQADVAAELMADDMLEVVQVATSPAHPRADICFPGSTLIQTPGGAVRIDEVQTGDMVLTHRSRARRVLHTMRSLVARGCEMVRLSWTDRSGERRSVVMTPNHPVRSDQGWTAARDLRTGSRVAALCLSADFRPRTGGTCGKEPSGSAENATACDPGSTGAPPHDGPQDLPSRCTAGTNGQCASTPTCVRRSACDERQDHSRHPSSSDSPRRDVRPKGAPELQANAETSQGAACRSSGCLILREACMQSCSRSFRGHSTRMGGCTSGTQPCGTRFRSTSEPGIVSGSLCGTEHRSFGSCFDLANIYDWVIVVKHLEDSKGEFVFNLEVEDDHTYVAGGLVVHNCDVHARANLFGLGPGNYPKAKAPRPPFHPHCLPGDTLVTSAGKITAATKRWFDGDVSVITTASGKRLTATINHPVLTARGWVPAGLVDVGDEVIARVVPVDVWIGVDANNKHQDVPTRISEIADTFLSSSEVAAREVPTSAEDFHGDGMAGNVAVVGANRELWDGVDAASAKILHDARFQRAHAGESALLGDGGLHKALEVFRNSANSVMRRLCHGGPPLGPDAIKADQVLLTDGADHHPGFHEPLGDSRAADTALARQIQDGATGPVFADKVINIERHAFSGHVYNLETETGHFTCNNIITHNCYCKLKPKYSLDAAGAREVPGGVAAYLRSMPVDEAARVMGSRQRLQRVLDGASVDSVVNAGVDPLYRLARLGDPGAGHVLVRAESAAVSNPRAPRSDIVAFAEAAAAVADRLVTLRIGPVNNAQRIMESTGLDLTGFDRMLDNYGIRHTLKQHGSSTREAARGQIAVALIDFGLIDLITSEPDAVFHGGRNKIGREVLVFTKLIDGIGYRHVEEVRSHRKLVATDSLRKKKGAWGS